MKTVKILSAIGLLVAVSALTASAQYFGGQAQDTRTVLVLRADGSVSLTNETVMPRKLIEMQIKASDRSSGGLHGPDETDGDEPGDSDQAPTPPKIADQPPKTLTDEQLAEKIRALHEKRSEFSPLEMGKLTAVEVSSNSVRTVSVQTFSSIKELLGNNMWSWGPNVLMLDDAQFETITNGQLKISFTSSENRGRYASQMARAMKASKTKFSWRLETPGKIISSGFPSTEGNATWLQFDGEKPETVDAVVKAAAASVVIVAESGGLKLDEPLSAKKLMRSMRHPAAENDNIPVTDAAAGYKVEAQGLMLTTVHPFPEGAELIKDRSESYGFSQTGIVVMAKITTPQGRELRSLSGIKVLSAKDDQGRDVGAAAAASEEDSEQISYTSSSRDGEDSAEGSSSTIQIRLGLPAADAQTIEELKGEVVAYTLGQWKEMLVTNAQSLTNADIDIGELVPGAKMQIKKVTTQSRQTTLQVVLTGPKTVSQIEAKIKYPTRGGSSSSYEQKSNSSGQSVTRTLRVQGWQFSTDGSKEVAPLTLRIRFPQDAKRERVRFTLNALDLL